MSKGAMGSRRRYLAEQAEFMKAQFDWEPVGKANWKAWPVPPNVKRIPRNKINVESTPLPFGGGSHHKVHVNGRHAGGMYVGRTRFKPEPVVESVGIREGYRRRGVGSELLRRAQAVERETINHSPARTAAGDAFARSTSRSLGGEVPTRMATPSASARFRGMRISERASQGSTGITRQRKPGRQKLAKGDTQPLKTHMKERDAKRVTARYGLAGELPKTLTREQRMGAYEARYVASGGRKGEKWQRRAETADKVKVGGLAVATAGGAAYLGTKGRLRNKINPKVKSIADTVAIGGATAGGAGELYGIRARRKRASYASAPGGAAASALRRMRAMDAAKGTA